MSEWLYRISTETIFAILATYALIIYLMKNRR